MGTTDLQPETGIGVIKRVGHSASILRDGASDVAYGRRGGSLWPLLLVVLAGSSSLLDVEVVMLISLTLLAIWIGGKR